MNQCASGWNWGTVILSSTAIPMATGLTIVAIAPSAHAQFISQSLGETEMALEKMDVAASTRVYPSVDRECVMARVDGQGLSTSDLPLNGLTLRPITVEDGSTLWTVAPWSAVSQLITGGSDGAWSMMSQFSPTSEPSHPNPSLPDTNGGWLVSQFVPNPDQDDN